MYSMSPCTIETARDPQSPWNVRREHGLLRSFTRVPLGAVESTRPSECMSKQEGVRLVCTGSWVLWEDWCTF